MVRFIYVVIKLSAVRKVLETIVFQALGSFGTLGPKLSHGTSSKFADVRTYLRKVFLKNTLFYKKKTKRSFFYWLADDSVSVADGVVSAGASLALVSTCDESVCSELASDAWLLLALVSVPVALESVADPSFSWTTTTLVELSFFSSVLVVGFMIL